MSNRNREVQFLSHNELKALLTAAKAHSRRLYTMVFLAYRHGLRASEICNLTVDAVDLDAGNIRCRRGKGSITNWQLLAKDEVAAVKRWLKDRGQVDSQYLFPSREGTPLSRSQFFRDFRKVAAAAGIPEGKRFPRTLKHSLGTHLANAGVPVQVIQQRLGHRNIQNTMVYLEVANGFVDKAVADAVMAGAVV